MFGTKNCVIDYYITVVPVQSGLLLLKEIRVLANYRTGFPPTFWGDFLLVIPEAESDPIPKRLPLKYILILF